MQSVPAVRIMHAMPSPAAHGALRRGHSVSLAYTKQSCTAQGGAVGALIKQHLPGSGLLHLTVSVAFASLGALCDFIAVPVLDVVLGRDLGADEEARHCLSAVLHTCLAVQEKLADTASLCSSTLTIRFRYMHADVML